MADQSVWSQLIDAATAGYIVNQKEKTNRVASEVAVQGPYPYQQPYPNYYQAQPVRGPGVPPNGQNFNPQGQNTGLGTLALAAAGYMMMKG